MLLPQPPSTGLLGVSPHTWPKECSLVMGLLCRVQQPRALWSCQTVTGKWNFQFCVINLGLNIMVSLATAISRSTANAEEGSCQNYSPRGNPSLLRAQQAPLPPLPFAVSTQFLPLPGPFSVCRHTQRHFPRTSAAVSPLNAGAFFPRICLPIFKELQPTCTARGRVLSVIPPLDPI